MENEKLADRKNSSKILGFWHSYRNRHPNTAQFLVFFMLSNGITLLQFVLMPLFKRVFSQTSLVSTNFQVLFFGQNFDGSDYYVFDYAAGSLAAGGGGGLAYFLAVQVTIGIAQIINFFAQRSITFKSNANIWISAFWYAVAYIVITIGAAAAQGFYKTPVYNLFINTWGMGGIGETIADVITMIINSAISFWVFFPIFKIIFKQKREQSA
ncbi:hypothetical protein [Paenibacillus sp. NPDC057967]|uniref:hypothetical protein n=1 Tax=Paenibacillus sp. NPDC057967 TaxID=3346293 RepID=UPI0036DF5015